MVVTDHLQYFKSIEKIEQEQLAKKRGISEESKLQQWRGALKQLRIDTSKKSSTVPANGELTPDSMTSRLADSAIAIDDMDKLEDGLKLTSMGSRVNSMSM